MAQTFPGNSIMHLHSPARGLLDARFIGRQVPFQVICPLCFEGAMSKPGNRTPVADGLRPKPIPIAGCMHAWSSAQAWKPGMDSGLPSKIHSPRHERWYGGRGDRSTYSVPDLSKDQGRPIFAFRRGQTAWGLGAEVSILALGASGRGFDRSESGLQRPR